jgi:pyruvate,water dikinase
MASNWISWFDDLDGGKNDYVGKKSANLGEMIRNGLHVPPGFALSVDAYTDFMSLSGAVKEIDNYVNSLEHDFDKISHFNDASEVLRRIVESKTLPEKMEEAILIHYRELCQKCDVEKVPVSVRSAGVASHPGQYETYLNVIGENDIIDKIKKVWSSTFNPRSLSARKRVGISLKSDPIGVAVMKMVNARSAGVLFTADPNTGDTNRMIIEANWGLGESVVGGEAMPDVYILNKETLEIVERKLGTKGKYVAFRDVGVIEYDTPTKKKDTFCLCDEEAKEIGRVGKILETHFGVPQDTEWAIEESLTFPDCVLFLQTRPEIIVQQKKPVEQVIDLMLNTFRS